MNIVVMHGQNHKGSTYHLAKMLLASLSAELQTDLTIQSQATRLVKEFFLPRDLPHFCSGCMRCLEGDDRCPYYDRKHPIYEAMHAADLLVFMTPTYCMRASAPMKAFLDLSFTYWMPHRPHESMFRKKAVILSTAAGMGTGSAIKDIRTSLTYWGVPTILTYGMKTNAQGWSDVSEEFQDKAHRAMQALAKRVINASAKPGIKTKAIFRIMRSMHKNHKGSNEFERSYWEEQGWLEDVRPW